MQQNFAIGNIQSFNEATPAEARIACGMLDGVKLIPLWEECEDEPGMFKECGRVQGVKNTCTGNVLMGVSSIYDVLPHQRAFGTVLDAMNEVSEDALIKIENHGNTAELYALYPSLRIKDDAKGMMMGVRFVNRYDQRQAFSGQTFCWREACLNGSTHVELGTFTVKTRHTINEVTEDGLKDKIARFIFNIKDSTQKMEDIVQAAISSEVTFRNFDQVAATLLPILRTQKATAAVTPTIALKTNRWEIFNAITAYASHGDVSNGTRNDLIRKADSKVLAVGELVPVAIEQAVIAPMVA